MEGNDSVKLQKTIIIHTANEKARFLADFFMLGLIICFSVFG